MPERDTGSPAQVIYHASPGEAQDRNWRALLRLQVAGAMSTAISEDPDATHLNAHDLMGAPAPVVPIGRTVGPTHTRRNTARTRIITNGTGLPIAHERVIRRTGPSHSALDVSPRCAMTDLLTLTCAHCLGHTLDEEDR